MNKKAIRKERLKSFGRWFIWLFIGFLIIRGVLSIVFQVSFTPIQSKESAANIGVADPVIPESAKSVASLFITRWFYVVASESEEDRLKRLSSYITSDLQNRIKADSLLTKAEMKADEEDGDKRKDRPLLQVHRLDIWDTEWIKKEELVSVTTRIMTSDGRVWYVAVPVKKSGSAWLVNDLPGLVPEPKEKVEEKAEEEPSLSDQQREEVIAVLDGFFPAWLSGKKEATARYTSADTKLSTSDVLGSVGGRYEAVEVRPLSESPFIIHASVLIRENAGTVMRFHYHVTMEEKDGQWFVIAIQ